MAWALSRIYSGGRLLVGRIVPGQVALIMSLQCVERSLLPKGPKFLQQPMSKYYNGYMVNNNKHTIIKCDSKMIKRNKQIL